MKIIDSVGYRTQPLGGGVRRIVPPDRLPVRVTRPLPTFPCIEQRQRSARQEVVVGQERRRVDNSCLSNDACRRPSGNDVNLGLQSFLSPISSIARMVDSAVMRKSMFVACCLALSVVATPDAQTGSSASN